MNDNLNNLDNSCNRLSDIANEARAKALITNRYTNINQYSSQHPNALANSNGTDDPLNIRGKGTGEFLDTSKGGGFYDIHGSPEVQDSGRLNLLLKNKYTNDKPYDCFIQE